MGCRGWVSWRRVFHGSMDIDTQVYVRFSIRCERLGSFTRRELLWIYERTWKRCHFPFIQNVVQKSSIPANIENTESAQTRDRQWSSHWMRWTNSFPADDHKRASFGELDRGAGGGWWQIAVKTSKTNKLSTNHRTVPDGLLIRKNVGALTIFSPLIRTYIHSMPSRVYYVRVDNLHGSGAKLPMSYLRQAL